MAGYEKGGYTLSDIDFSGWIHVCIVLDMTDNTVYVYIDGVSVPVVLDHNESLPTIDNNGAVCIGGNPNVPNLYYQGAVDDVRLYNYALSATEVADMYN